MFGIAFFVTALAAKALGALWPVLSVLAVGVGGGWLAARHRELS